MNSLKILFLAALCISFGASGQTTQIKELTDGNYSTYTSNNNLLYSNGLNVSFNYPKNWARTEKSDHLYQIRSESGKGSELCFLNIRQHAYINDTKELEEYYSSDYIKSNLIPSVTPPRSSEFISSEKITINGKIAGHYDYYFSHPHTITLIVSTTNVYHGTNLVEFNCTIGDKFGRSNKKEMHKQYNKISSLFKAMANSIVIK